MAVTSVLKLHQSQKCDCYDESVANNLRKCVYQDFLDGWSFTPDAGYGKSRGEVFTPKFIVDKMIADSGMFPPEAVYDGDYSTLTVDEKLEKISARVLEPAVGTGNFISTIVWHKLKYAESVVRNTDTSTEDVDLPLYNRLVLESIASVYVFDIDPGNLETTSRRILSSELGDLNGSETVDKWVGHIIKAMSTDVGEDNVTKFVVGSLNAAQNNWFKNVSDNQGIVDKLYREVVGESLPGDLRDLVEMVMGYNFLLFNGIVEEDTIEDGFVVPGWRNVVWKWWDVAGDAESLTCTPSDVPLRKQILEGKIEELERSIELFKKDNFEFSSDDLFGSQDMKPKNSDAKTKYNKMSRELDRLVKELNSFSEI